MHKDSLNRVGGGVGRPEGPVGRGVGGCEIIPLSAFMLAEIYNKG